MTLRADHYRCTNSPSCGWRNAVNTNGSPRGVPSSPITRKYRSRLYKSFEQESEKRLLSRTVLIDQVWDAMGKYKHPDGSRITQLDAMECAAVQVVLADFPCNLTVQRRQSQEARLRLVEEELQRCLVVIRRAIEEL